MKTIRALEEADISRLMDDPEIRTVSFDFFDTLFLRPCICPKDIFYLPDTFTEREYGVCFSELRLNAEEELGEDNAALEDIWSFAADKNSLSDEIKSKMIQTELELELRLLQPRDDVKRLYQKAVSTGKKIWIVSDMYLPSEFLGKVLSKAGYKQASRIFVSCEYKKRKDTGELYDLIIKEENITDPSTWLHIGDNFESDYKAPLSKGILSVYYPSVWDSVINSETPWGGLFPDQHISDDPMTRILFCLAMIKAWNDNVFKQNGERFFYSVRDFARLFLAPLLTAIATDLLNNSEIKKYQKICFAARDGYLPEMIYEILSKDQPAAESRYLYVSRMALGFSEYTDYFDFIEHIQVNRAELSLGGLIENTVLDEDTRKNIAEDLSPDEKELPLFSEHKKVAAILGRYRDQLNTYFKEQRILSRKYYQKEFEHESGRQIVFDCGYSGSVSRGLSNALENRLAFDKYYLWEMQSNQQYDRVNGTKTICFFKSDLAFFNIILEECFSPSEGSCIGFGEKGGVIQPVLAKEAIPDQMEGDLEEIREACCDFANVFRQRVGYYLSGFQIKDTDLFTKIARTAFIRSPYCEAGIFDRIIFTDLFQPEKRSLAAKTYRAAERCGEYISTVEGTGFENPENMLDLRLDNAVEQPGRMGIHLHLYHGYIYEEIYWYLRKFPFSFDLYITVIDQKLIAIAKKMFIHRMIPSLEKTEILLVPNRGRDVAPWIINVGEKQKKYDYFCHIHTKESGQYGGQHGENWRRYLYENLMTAEAVIGIMALFKQNDNLGVVFPKAFPKVLEIFATNKIPPVGEFGEEKLINALLRRLSINDTIERADLVFSVGTMMWYRPKAIEKLFRIGICINEFAEEPVGAGGTLAHAIERIFSILAEYHGYRIGTYNVTFGTAGDLSKLRKEITALHADLDKTSMDLQNILNSKSFKTGRAITFAMRKLRDGNAKIKSVVKRIRKIGNRKV